MQQNPARDTLKLSSSFRRVPTRVLPPSVVWPNRRLSSGWFRRKGKLYSLIHEWRGMSLWLRAHTLPDRPWAGLFYRDFVTSWRGWSSLCRCSFVAYGSRSQCWLQCLYTWPGAAILNCSVVWSASIHSLPAEVSAQLFHTRKLGLKCQVPEASTCDAQTTSKTRQSTKERKKKKVRLYSIAQILYLSSGIC